MLNCINFSFMKVKVFDNNSFENLKYTYNLCRKRVSSIKNYLTQQSFLHSELVFSFPLHLVLQTKKELSSL